MSDTQSDPTPDPQSDPAPDAQPDTVTPDITIQPPAPPTKQPDPWDI
ncbi:MAG TPA: hypothetical protein VK586_04470 [Streptosporangiaceae bacterium]|nr:hypothetical protein [Streptosporangiaceae bacterium]